MDKETRDAFKVAAGNVPKATVRSLTGTILLEGHDHRALTPNECNAIATLMMMGRDVAEQLNSLTGANDELRHELTASKALVLEQQRKLDEVEAQQAQSKAEATPLPETPPKPTPPAGKPPTPKARPKAAAAKKDG